MKYNTIFLLLSFVFIQNTIINTAEQEEFQQSKNQRCMRICQITTGATLLLAGTSLLTVAQYTPCHYAEATTSGTLSCGLGIATLLGLHKNNNEKALQKWNTDNQKLKTVRGKEVQELFNKSIGFFYDKNQKKVCLVIQPSQHSINEQKKINTKVLTGKKARIAKILIERRENKTNNDLEEKIKLNQEESIGVLNLLDFDNLILNNIMIKNEDVTEKIEKNILLREKIFNNYQENFKNYVKIFVKKQIYSNRHLPQKKLFERVYTAFCADTYVQSFISAPFSLSQTRTTRIKEQEYAYTIFRDQYNKIYNTPYIQQWLWLSTKKILSNR